MYHQDSLPHSYLEYASVVWDPLLIKDHKILERMFKNSFAEFALRTGTLIISLLVINQEFAGWSTHSITAWKPEEKP